MSRKRTAITKSLKISDFVCLICGGEFHRGIVRTKLKEKGHVKDLPCIKCGCTTKHMELRVLVPEDKYQYGLDPRAYIQQYALPNVKGPGSSDKHCEPVKGEHVHDWWIYSDVNLIQPTISISYQPSLPNKHRIIELIYASGDLMISEPIYLKFTKKAKKGRLYTEDSGQPVNPSTSKVKSFTVQVRSDLDKDKVDRYMKTQFNLEPVSDYTYVVRIYKPEWFMKKLEEKWGSSNG